MSRIIDDPDFPVEATLEAFGPYLPTPPARVLEIGCGDGRLAAALVARGFSVTALDEDPSCVAAAAGREVDARLCRWPCEVAIDGFDAVLFTRSLHHVADLDGGLDAARAALSRGGVLIVQDWAWETVDRRAAAVAARLVGLARAVGCEVGDGWPGEDDDPLEHWFHHMEAHGLHPWATQRQGLSLRFEQRLERSDAYYYRYFCSKLAEVEAVAPIAGAVLALERTLIEQGVIRPLGRLWVGT